MDHASRLSWRDDSLGSRVRVALWLRDEVGEGGIFTKQALRTAIRGVEQVDRRMRDLRPAGWTITTYKDRADLRANELCLEKIGAPIWETRHRSTGIRATPDNVRRDINERDGFRCVRCGAAGGERYADDPERVVQITIAGASGDTGRGSDAGDLITVCARCGGYESPSDGALETVWAHVVGLNAQERQALFQWMVEDRRVEVNDLDATWGSYRRLPSLARGVLRRRLGKFLTS